MRVRRLVGGAGAGLLAVVLTGCGSSSPTPRATTTTSSTTTTTTVPVTTTTLAPTTTTTTAVPVTTTTVPPKVNFLAQSASFTSAADGFVLGVAHCPPQNCLALRATTDGGVTWHSLTAPGPPGVHGLDGMTGIVFADANDGWAFGHSFWSTHDAAEGWTQLKLGGAVAAVADGAGEAYALVDPCEGSATCTTPAHLDRSPIGEDAWTKFTATKFSRGEGALVVEGTTVFVLTRAITTTAATLSSSVNGGPFKALPDPCPASLALSSLAANSPTAVAVSCVGAPSNGGAAKAVYVSGNGGASFTALTMPPENGVTASVAFPGPTTVLLAANSTTSDVFQQVGGQAWAAKLSLLDGALGISDLTFLDTAHGYLVDGAAQVSLPLFKSVRSGSPVGDVYVTTDGGALWQPLSLAR